MMRTRRDFSATVLLANIEASAASKSLSFLCTILGAVSPLLSRPSCELFMCGDAFLLPLPPASSRTSSCHLACLLLFVLSLASAPPNPDVIERARRPPRHPCLSLPLLLLFTAFCYGLADKAAVVRLARGFGALETALKR